MDLHPLLISTGVVAIAEIGDKTQLLAIVLAAKFRKPLPIILGILAATLLNHAAAATVGFLISEWLTGRTFQIVVGAAFLAMAGWALIPDKPDEGPKAAGRVGAFVATTIAFFLVEIGDKTQIATVALAARFENIVVVTAGTTLGMMIANVPAVLGGELLARKVPLRLVRLCAAASFVLLGVAVLLWG